MIRQLNYRCWYLDGGPWQERHFATEALALADEATAAEEYEYQPRPARHCAAPCWAAERDRCERPAGDDNDWDTPAHDTDQEQLLTTLNTKGWLRGHDRRVCCADCAAAGPSGAAIQRVPVTIDWAGSRREVLGEVTACPDLVIMPGRNDQPDCAGLWLGLRLVHRPTGRYLPTPGGWSIGVLHRMAQLLTGLDWSCPEVEHYAIGYSRATVAAYRQASEEYLSQLYPTGEG